MHGTNWQEMGAVAQLGLKKPHAVPVTPGPITALMGFGISQLHRSPQITHKSPLVHCLRKPISAYSGTNSNWSYDSVSDWTAE